MSKSGVGGVPSQGSNEVSTPGDTTGGAWDRLSALHHLRGRLGDVVVVVEGGLEGGEGEFWRAVYERVFEEVVVVGEGDDKGMKVRE